MIEYWKDKDVELLVDVKPNRTFLGKENTATENSDVFEKVTNEINWTY